MLVQEDQLVDSKNQEPPSPCLRVVFAYFDEQLTAFICHMTVEEMTSSYSVISTITTISSTSGPRMYDIVLFK